MRGILAQFVREVRLARLGRGRNGSAAVAGGFHRRRRRARIRRDR